MRRESAGGVSAMATSVVDADRFSSDHVVLMKASLPFCLLAIALFSYSACGYGDSPQVSEKHPASASYIRVTLLVDVSPQGTVKSVKLLKVEPGVEDAQKIADSAEKAVWTWSFHPDPKTGKPDGQMRVVVGVDMSDNISITSKEFVPSNKLD